MVWSDYTWIFVCSIFLALFVAWGIGANDVANSFATTSWLPVPIATTSGHRRRDL
jgi:hypothetical protein